MKKIYSLFHSVTFYVVSVLIIFVFLFTQNYIVSFLAQQYLKEYDVSYSKIEGSLLQGIVLHDIEYTDALSMKRLQINYNLLNFLRPSPKLNKIKIEGLFLDLSKIPELDSNATETSFLSFGISTIELKNTKVITSDETLEFDLKAKGFYYNEDEDENVDVDSLWLDFKSSYANALVKGSISSNTFKGDSLVVVSEATSKQYLGFLKSVPKALNIKIKATLNETLLSTNIKSLRLKDDENLSIDDADIKLKYCIDDNTLEADAAYKVDYLEFETILNQTLSLSSDKKYKSQINANITKSPVKLPFKSIDVDVFGDENSLHANIKAGSIDSNISSKDYKSFSIYSDNEYFKVDGTFESTPEQELFEALISAKLKNKFYKDYPMELVSPMKIMYKNYAGLSNVNIDAKRLHVKLVKKEKHLNGFGTFGSNNFTIFGNENENADTQINISTKIPSIKKLMSELQLKSKESKIQHEGQAEINTTLNFGEIFSAKNDIHIPKYTFKTDSNKSDVIEDIFLSTKYINKKLTIDNYSAHYMNQKLYSNKPCIFLVDENENIVIQEFWFQEKLYASGFIDMDKKKLDIVIESDKFPYSFDNIDIAVQTNLNASIDGSGIQKIKGNVVLLEVLANKEPIALPTKKINAAIFANEKDLKIKIEAGDIDFDMSSKDYEHFIVKSDNEYFKMDGEIILEKDNTSSWVMLNPKLKNKFYKNYPLQLFSPININYNNLLSAPTISVEANLLHVTLLKNTTNIEGFGTLGSSNFTLSSKTGKNEDNVVSLSTKVPSIKQLLSELDLNMQNHETFYDGKAEINSTIVFNDNFSIINDIHMPWFTITKDSDKTYLLEDISISTEYDDKKLIVNRYFVEYMQHSIYSNKPSRFTLDKNDNIVIKNFWIFDNLLANGFIDTNKNNVDIHVKSDKFTYEGKEANVSAKADLQVSIHSSGKQNIEGNITLLDGVINYEPPQDYVLTNKDIIVTQDIKVKRDSNISVNVSINSLRPISYKTQDVDIKITPDIVIYQDFDTPLKLFGMATINDGKITAGDKEFEFETSEVYFNGEDPINPQLNLNLHYYTLDHIDIEIFITNTLSAPILIFSSKPAMSQNDIMSYVLFGEPASSLFEGSNESTRVSVSSLILGSGLKQIFNDTAGIQVDTFNILSNKEGTLGYEIGTKFSKKVRIIYRSDTVSSVIMQYSLSRSIRVDVDVDETGQGVNIIYVKDF